MSATDAADAAGGEAIYSSDGLPPLPTPVPPVKSKQAEDANDDDDGAVLDSETMSATDAFEVFGGRAYLRPNARRGVAASSRGGLSSSVAAETPLARLARLSAEVRELERDLAAAPAPAAEQEQEGGGEGDGQPSGEELARLAWDLSSRLEAAAKGRGIVGGDKNVSALFRGRQEDLTKMVREERGRVESSGGDGGKDGGGGAGGVVYELYASSASGPAGGPEEASQTSGAVASAEERIGRIERAVGTGVSSTSLPSSSSGAIERTVMVRLEEAEKLAAKVDEKAIDAAAARAKVIRADLEAAAKAKSKLSAALSATSPEDAKTISSLHAQLLDLEGMSAHLPAVASRLQDLSTLHTQAADFATRLTAVEGAAVDAERLLRGVEDALGKVEEGFRVNAGAVEKNVAALDERLKKMSG